jgi:ferredoxin
MNLIVKHQRSACIGCGSCVAVAPEFWSLNSKDGLADLKGSTCNASGFCSKKIESESERKDHEAAVQACPVNVIEVVKE